MVGVISLGLLRVEGAGKVLYEYYRPRIIHAGDVLCGHFHYPPERTFFSGNGAHERLNLKEKIEARV